MNPERTLKWTDSRLDDKFEVVTDELRSLRNLPNVVAEIAVEFRHIREDIHNCFEAQRETNQKLDQLASDTAGKIDELASDTTRKFDEAEDKREKREELQRAERKSDRHWIVGSALSAAGLVIAALALLADRL